jgi:hypothetical protein
LLIAETVILKAYREMARQGEKLRGTTVRITLHPEIRSALPVDLREGILQLARVLGAHVLWVERTDGPRHGLGFDVLPGKNG